MLEILMGAHSPFSKRGCKILVKLRQFDMNDKSRIVIREDDYKWLPGICQGLTVMRTLLSKRT